MTQTLLFLLGIVIFYLVFSPRLRNFLWGKITGNNVQKPITHTAPVSRITRRKSPDVNGNGELEIDNETLDQYLQNPDVRVKVRE